MDLSKILLHSALNAFKNNSNPSDVLSLPTSLAAGATWTDSVSFMLASTTSFIQTYIYSTDYSDSFRYPDSEYHDYWHPLNVSESSLIYDVATFLYFYDINIYINEGAVTATLIIENDTGSTVNYDHPTYEVPITLIDYSLAN